MSNAGTIWSLREDNQLYGELEIGMSIPEIALVHGRTEHAIMCRIIKLKDVIPLSKINKSILNLSEATHCVGRICYLISRISKIFDA
jgi:hypothetical protein